MDAYSVAQVAQEIGEPVTTVRFWTGQFAASFGPLVDRSPGGHRRFSPQAVALLAHVKGRLHEDHATIVQVRAELEASGAPPAEAEARTPQVRTLEDAFAAIEELRVHERKLEAKAKSLEVKLGNYVAETSGLQDAVFHFEQQYRSELEEMRSAVHGAEAIPGTGEGKPHAPMWVYYWGAWMRATWSMVWDLARGRGLDG